MKNKCTQKKDSTRVIKVMILMYCQKHHGSKDELCELCTQTLEYCSIKYEKCHYGDKKPPCSLCSTNCHNLEIRKSIRDIMRYSGPRMFIYHPILAIQHTYHVLIWKKRQNK